LTVNETPSHVAFGEFLRWLDEGVDSGGERYLEMRRRLAGYFDRRGCLAADDLADETLARVARRFQEEGGITDTLPARYCYIVAKFVFLEHIRQARRTGPSLDEVPALREPASPAALHDGSDGAEVSSEQLLDCLEDCLAKLPPDDRELILAYYRGERREKIEHRREIAERFGLTSNSLCIRACRIRNRLETCVKARSAEK